MCALRCGALLLFLSTLLAAETGGRLLSLDDLAKIHEVADPQCSPDGKWVAFTVSSVDSEADKRNTHIWMATWDGNEELELTYGSESESSPRWSPDGRYLSFISSRAGKVKGSQVWLLDRRGGEGRQITHFKQYDISGYDWAPDSKKLALVLREKEEPDTDEDAKPDSKSAATPKPPKPVVINRYRFKEDVQGYVADKHNHVYTFDITTEKLDEITSGNFDENGVVWSPDGKQIAFLSNHDKDPDRTENTDVFVVDAHPGAVARRLTDYPGPDIGPLAWSPDGKLIAYLQGSESKYTAYNMDRLAVVPVAGGRARVLTAAFDRGVSSPVFTSGGRSLLVLVADDRLEYPAEISLAGGSLERLLGQPITVSGVSSRAGRTAILAATDREESSVFALDSGVLRKLSHCNDSLFSTLKLGAVEDISFKSPDGTEVHGLLTKPPDFESGKKYPALLRIHGGPNGQDEHAFNFGQQLFAANGYVVISVNYRGSAGRGEKYGESIFGDWGHKEVMDLLAAVDSVVRSGVADPDKLGVGGWSYGGILTDYLIASDGRFKAAISGAGSANQISMYGADQYVFQYDNELGPPWRNPQGWIKVSYPFFHADRIHTPTLFMGGDKDFNVPLIGGEQMYQALQTLGIPAELVIYPGESHEFKRPSFLKDRYERYLAWYGKYLKPGVSPKPGVQTGAN